MAAIRSAIPAAVACLTLLACGGDDDASTTTLASDRTDQAETTSSDVDATVATTITTASPVTTTPVTTTPAPTSTSTATTTTTTPTATTTTATTTTTVPAPESARYRVTVLVEWSAETHPATLPSGSHTSPPVLAAHATPGDMVPIGDTASAGIESMAETGKTQTLSDELAADPAVGEVDIGQRVDGAGSDVLEVVATRSTPLLSLVTMLAPSPDWFVGVADVPVFENGAWSERVELDLTPWDAGTDSGPEFTSDDADTQPRQTISGPVDPNYVDAAAEGRFGYVLIERID